jgi:hypothetical protein
MWVGTGRGLVRLFDDDSAVRYPVPSTAAQSPVRDMARGVDGQLWVAYPRGLLRLCAAPYTCLPGTRTQSAQAGVEWIDLPGAEIGESALAVSTTGRVWVGTDRGLLEFDGHGFRQYGAAHGLPTRLISELAEDRDQNLWIASLSGVIKLNPDGFLSYDEHDGLTSARIHALFENARGELFAVGGNWIVSRFDGVRFESVTPRVPPGPPRWGAQLAFLDRGNSWWILGDAALGRYPPVARIEQKRHEVLAAGELQVARDRVHIGSMGKHPPAAIGLGEPAAELEARTKEDLGRRPEPRHLGDAGGIEHQELPEGCSGEELARHLPVPSSGAASAEDDRQELEVRNGPRAELAAAIHMRLDRVRLELHFTLHVQAGS